MKHYLKLYRVIKNVIKIWSIKIKAHKEHFIHDEEMLSSINRNPRLIISITSYGKRVYRSLPYTLYSLTYQTLKPDMIVVWLDENKWNDMKLNKTLHRFKEKGVLFKYCEDIRSYTKLIPALLEYPNDVIITLDDDIFYQKRKIEQLYNSYVNNPQGVHYMEASKITLNAKNEIAPSIEWQYISKVNSCSIPVPLGVYGVLYAPGALNNEVFKKDIFLSLALTTDDLWFFLMGIMNNNFYFYVGPDEAPDLYIDKIYQYFHSNSALFKKNCLNNANDICFNKLIDFYSCRQRIIQKLK